MDSADKDNCISNQDTEVDLSEVASCEDYEVLGNLGKGAYGTVDAAKDKKTGKVYAMKTIEFSDLQECGMPANAMREVSILRELDHPNVVSLKQIIYVMPKLYLFMEYMDSDLKVYIDENKPLSNSSIQKIMKQILAGVSEMHSSRIIHRDIKPENIFIDKMDNIKLGDFGISRTLKISSKPMTPELVTIFYRAPELLLGIAEYSIPVDMWSVGCVFAELFLGMPLFIAESEIDLLNQIFKARGAPSEQTWPGVSDVMSKMTPKYPNKKIKIEGMDEEAIDLLNKILVLNPSERVTAKEALKHPYFDVDYN